MPVYEFNGHKPEIDPSAYIAPGAMIIGKVRLAAQSSIWFNAVLRGDIEEIVIGPGSNVQDNACMHTDAGYPAILGSGVTLGHGAIVHGAHIGDNTVVGMNAVVLSGAEVGANCIIAAGAVVAEKKVIPPNSLVVGIPGKVIRMIPDSEVPRLQAYAEHYVVFGEKYKEEKI